MFPVKEILPLILRYIAVGVFNFTFILVILIIYLMYKKNSMLLPFSLGANKVSVKSQMIEVIIQGILAGILGSIVVVVIGFPISLNPLLILLLPIAIVLSLFNMRYFCFSYSAAILGLIEVVVTGLNSLGFDIPRLNIDISGLIALVAILHLMEAILIFIGGADNNIPIVVKRDKKIAVGFLMQKFWPLPFTLLVFELGTKVTGSYVDMPDWWPLLGRTFSDPASIVYTLIPLTAALGYGNVALTIEPHKKAKQSSYKLALYSVILLALAVLSREIYVLKIVGIIVMPTLHDLMIVLEQKKQRESAPLYTLPDKGVRVVSLVQDGYGEKIGLRSGDVIKKINDIEVLNYRQMMAILNNYFTFMWIEVERIDGKTITLEYKAYPKGINTFNIVHLPEYPRLTYNLNEMQNTGIINVFKARKRM